MSAHFLSLGPLPSEEEARQTAHSAVLSDVAQLHAQNGRLTAILVLGTSGNRVSAEDFILDVQVACDELGYEPLVVPVPGPADLQLPATRLLMRSLTEDWGRNASDLWAGSLAEDVIAPLETKVFADIMTWHNDTARATVGWNSGRLPGDGSLSFVVGGRTIGLVSVNTVFRMVTEEADPRLAGCFAEQLNLAVGGDFATWTSGNDLTLVAAGLAGEWPDVPQEVAPLVKIAGIGESGRDWLLLPDEAVRHRLLQVDLSGSRVKVRDQSDGQAISTAARSRARAQGPHVRSVQAAEAPYDERPLLDAFHQNLSTGRMTLVLVSGPEPGPPITVDELHRRLAEAVYGAVPSPIPYPLHEIWAVAKQLPGKQRAQYLSELHSPAGDVPTTGHGLLRAPWSRIYDFTGSDLLWQAWNADPAGISFVNACAEQPSEKREALEVVAMHGRPQDEGHAQDFGDPEKLPLGRPRQMWARRFRAELLERPVLFVSLSPDSPALWNVLMMAGRDSGEHDFPGFLVTPEGTATDRARLRPTGLHHIRSAPSGFITRQLAPDNQSYQRGKQLLAQEHEGSTRQIGVQRVALLVKDAPAGDGSFLRGRDPHWGDIKKPRITPRLSLFNAIADRIRSSDDGRMPIVLVKGNAGTGKTTALMQLAYQLHRNGSQVGWVDRETQLTSAKVTEQTRQQNLHAVFVDDVDIFKSNASTLMQDLNEGGKRLVVGATRSSRNTEIPRNFPAEIEDFNRDLTNNDLRDLIRALERNALIGSLKQYRSPREKLDKLGEWSEKGLLAAMIKAVTGSTLPEKIMSEYDDLAKLGPEYQWAYAAVCVFHSEVIFRGNGIHSTTLLEIVSYPYPPTRVHYAAVRGLQEMGLLVVRGGMLRCRQRTIADEVLRTALRQRPVDLELVMTKLLLSYAERARHIHDDQAPDRRAMIRLLNHSVFEKLRLPVEAARRIYDEAHPLLHDDRHYWLQRAEFEIDNDNLPLAHTYVKAGRGCPRGLNDFRLITCSARIRLRYSTAVPTDMTRLQDAKEAVRDLHDVVRGPDGKSAPHAFVALARDATKWLLKCSQELGYQQYVDLREQITDDVAHRTICTDRNDVDTAAKWFESQQTRLQDCEPGLPL